MRRSFVWGLVALVVAASATPAVAAEASPRLLPPTGVLPVGSSTWHLVDSSRPDTWVPEAGPRELMVSLYYPSSRPVGQRKQYMTPLESELLLKEGGISSLPYDVLSRTRTHAVVDAPPVGRWPLVVLSPGFTKPRATLSGLAEDLASHGYVVAVLDHTYESVATTFPDGRVAECVACEITRPPDTAHLFWKKLHDGRAADVSFVIDSVLSRWGRFVDPARIGMAGHSAGGAAGIPSMMADPRIKAGVNLDGRQDVSLAGPLSRPFLFLGREEQYTPGASEQAGTWADAWSRLAGWKRWLVVRGMTHASFTDVGLLGWQLGLDFGAEVPGDRASVLTRRYVRAFLDEHFRGGSAGLMDGPSARYPEVKFCDPASGCA
ncbi:alpha/beta hydrolase [Amycolatopsis sp. 195334CR]|uniref:alpha/beta hydrolase family protein n=1 Tax=Amycolatopsis sp. 195334CR TaxID=2814588 RepID=UPI001A8CB2E1|nr:alpha/beta hydrolase [Amycolatopsis sp. 195334CR]MBN6034426.1 alpha/beta hydrolase [Amycolatopsis sp. 195334CR]